MHKTDGVDHFFLWMFLLFIFTGDVKFSTLFVHIIYFPYLNRHTAILNMTEFRPGQSRKFTQYRARNQSDVFGARAHSHSLSLSGRLRYRVAIKNARTHARTRCSLAVQSDYHSPMHTHRWWVANFSPSALFWQSVSSNPSSTTSHSTFN